MRPREKLLLDLVWKRIEGREQTPSRKQQALIAGVSPSQGRADTRK